MVGTRVGMQRGADSREIQEVEGFEFTQGFKVGEEEGSL